MDFNLCFFANGVFHASGSHSQDHDVLKMDMVTQVYAVSSTVDLSG
jgi:hypothetical protein